MHRWTPRVTVAVVVERAGRYLMVEESRGGPFTLFNQPAGHLEPQERLVAAAERETREEAAWQIAVTHYLGLYVHRTAEGIVFHSHGFTGLALAHLGTPLDSDIRGAHWLTFDEIDDLDRAQRLRSAVVMQRLRDARDDRRYPLSVIHER